MITGDRPLVPLGFETESVVASPNGLPSVPLQASYAYIQAQGGNLRWCDFGNPDGSTGHLLSNGEDLWYVGDLKKLRFCKDTASSDHTITVSYYKLL